MGGMRELLRIASGNRNESEAVRAIAAEQAGILSRSQLLGAGVSATAIHRAVHSGRLHRIHRGVYATVAPELVAEDGLLIAALHAAGSGALLSHATAAWRWQLIPARPVRIELTVPRPRLAPEGLMLHAGARFRRGDITHHAPFPTTTVPRTLLDLATRYSHDALLRALAEAEFHHDVRPADVVQTLRRGHPGSARLRAALDAHAPGHGQVRSNLERRFRRLLVRNGIELPRRNQLLGPWTVDCLWPERRVVIELDGRQHARPSQADRDDDRDLWLRANRYIVRRYGDRQIGEQPQAVIADLEAAFAEAATLGYAGRGTSS
jgi:very-short-patch-repair endonuclease/predicted transcriptional regulator of viral defense system